MKHYILFGFVVAMLVVTGFAQNTTTIDVTAFKQALEKDGFTVQQGATGFFDVIKLYRFPFKGKIAPRVGFEPTISGGEQV